MYVKGIIIMLLLILMPAAAEDMICLTGSKLENILTTLKTGEEFISSGLIEVESKLAKSEQNQIELQQTIETQDESIQKQQNCIEALDLEQSELKQDLSLSMTELDNLKNYIDEAEKTVQEWDRQQQEKIASMTKNQGIQTMAIIGEGVVILILSVILCLE